MSAKTYIKFALKILKNKNKIQNMSCSAGEFLNQILNFKNKRF